jgi:protein SCO1/2
MKKIFGYAFVMLSFAACKSTVDKTALPIYGNHNAVTIKGKTDTVYQTIPGFKTINQYGDSITNVSLNGNIYVADFFFTTCPSICPTMHRNMLKVYDAFKAEKDIKIISYTIDPKHDSVAVLKKYADKMGITGNSWWLLQGNKEEIYKLSESYLVGKPKEDARQQFIHDGFFVLIDKQKRIRGFYDGTLPEQVDKLVTDIKKLKTEPDQLSAK